MTTHTHRGNLARLLVLIVVGILALTWCYVAGTDSTPAPSATPVKPALQASWQAAAQPVAPSVTPVPAALPAPADQAQVGKRAGHRHNGRHAQHRRHHGGAAARHGRKHHGRHHGKHHSRHHAKHHTRHHVRHHVVRTRGAGRDIGWPQCPHDVGFRGRNGLGQPLPDPGVRFVIVGLTNGRAFTPNPCLDLHLDWVRSHHVYASAYAFATYPTRAQLQRYRHSGPYDGNRFLGALGNAGHAAARYNIRTMDRHGFTTPHVWLDLEPSSSRPWSGRRSWNRAVVRGWVRAYKEAGYGVGFYSTTSLWDHIVGGLRLGLPEWRTAGPASSRAALGRCGESGFQGGPAVIAQWWTDHRDLDRLCPTASRSVTWVRYFHKW